MYMALALLHLRDRLHRHNLITVDTLPHSLPLLAGGCVPCNLPQIRDMAGGRNILIIEVSALAGKFFPSRLIAGSFSVNAFYIIMYMVDRLRLSGILPVRILRRGCRNRCFLRRLYFLLHLTLLVLRTLSPAQRIADSSYCRKAGKHCQYPQNTCQYFHKNFHDKSPFEPL